MKILIRLLMIDDIWEKHKINVDEVTIGNKVIKV